MLKTCSNRDREGSLSRSGSEIAMFVQAHHSHCVVRLFTIQACSSPPPSSDCCCLQALNCSRASSVRLSDTSIPFARANVVAPSPASTLCGLRSITKRAAEKAVMTPLRSERKRKSVGKTGREFRKRTQSVVVEGGKLQHPVRRSMATLCCGPRPRVSPACGKKICFRSPDKYSPCAHTGADSEALQQQQGLSAVCRGPVGRQRQKHTNKIHGESFSCGVMDINNGQRDTFTYLIARTAPYDIDFPSITAASNSMTPSAFGNPPSPTKY